MMVLVSKSTLYSCAWDGTFQKLLLTVQKDILLVGDDDHALPGLHSEGVFVGVPVLVCYKNRPKVHNNAKNSQRRLKVHEHAKSTLTQNYH